MTPLLCLVMSTQLHAQPAADSLEAAIRLLQREFGTRYPQADVYLAELARAGEDNDADAFGKLKRKALLANPLIAENPILFVTRPQYTNEHGTEATMYQTGEVNTRVFRGGGALRLLDVKTGKITRLVDAPEGIVRDPEVHFDGKRILFSMRRNIKDDYHIYEVHVDSKKLRQLTRAPRVSDIQPIYLPGDGIVFSSTRDPKYIPCQRHLMANLFRMNGDGSNIEQIGYNTQFEGRASLMPDGRVLYTRWEYVDKHFAPAYGLWTVNPDGTNHELYYGGYAWQPGTIADGRTVPGTNHFVAIFTSPHDLSRGAMVIGDPSRGLDGTQPILHSWPPDISRQMARWDEEDRIGNGYDSFRQVRPYYETPYPLSDRFFLCSRLIDSPDLQQMGIYLVDTFGNEVLVCDRAPGCFDPMPLRARKRPPVITSRVDHRRNSGEFYVQDVYRGKDMAGVKRGSVKYVRVVEAPSKRTWVPKGCGDWSPPGSADSHHPVAVNWNHYNHKRILGTAPVEVDGSAYFTVPAGRFVYFQLLDERGMMIHSMRSGTMLQPGERKGCVGCHDNYKDSTSPQLVSAALTKPPRKLADWYGPERNFSYAAEVQPVLDRHCVSCHDYGKEAESLNLSGDKGVLFSQSYVNLLRTSPSNYVRSQHDRDDVLPMVSLVGAGPVKTLPPHSWGAQRSRLMRLLIDGHYDVKLDRESFERIAAWIDLNGPYYPGHRSYYVGHTAGRSPLNHADLRELGQLVKQAPNGTTLGWDRVNEYQATQLGKVMASHGPPVNFTRPQQSACLQAFNSVSDPGYRRALELIRKGQNQLIAHPRFDMPGFVPSAMHGDQLEYLQRRNESEVRSRAAIRRGTRVYDGATTK
ncbi:MAG: hypothetical protein GY903_04830 [Fuerstiella sp.]|nr:hypothetical protein [Fuerstiella sp.]MCP4853799.1 hypothetical protein [Fuerstiella sp.]